MKVIQLFFAAAWLAAAAAGSWGMMKYENRPGSAGNPPQKWPSESRITRAGDQPTIVMVVHPHCPCTRASLGELAILMARCYGKAQAHVLFAKPRGSTEEWERTDLWRTALAIPGVSVFTDEGSEEANRFGAETSGQTLLFDGSGKLLFSGGITASRGHSGDNAGRDAIVGLLSTGGIEQHTTAVFGCALCNE
jgi:hypothetical protein